MVQPAGGASVRRGWWALLLGALSVGCGQTRQSGAAPPGEEPAEEPVDVPTRTGPNCAVSVASDGAGYCAAYEDGSVWCWGRDPDPTRVEVPGRVSQLFMGAGNACAAVSGRIYCWGDNAQRQLRDELGPVETPFAVELGTSTPVLSVAIDAQHLCAIDQLLHVSCRGGALTSPTQVGVDSIGILSMPGPGTEVLDAAGRVFSLAEPQRPDLLDGLGTDNAALITGFFNAPVCQLKRAGSLWCTDYVLDQPSAIRAKVALGESVTSAAAGDLFVCALTDSDRVWCEGWNRVGQAGRGSTETFAEGGYVPEVTNVRKLAVARASACALRLDGSVWCWGTYSPNPASIASHEVTSCENQGESLARAVRMAPRGSARLQQAGAARSQALCECAFGVDAPELEACLVEETSAPNAACVEALAPNHGALGCLAKQQWEEAQCFQTSPECGRGLIPASCVAQSPCVLGPMAGILNYCRRRACADGEPMSPSRLCDGTVDCEDGSDERNCAPADMTFDCGDDQHVPLSAVCDGTIECKTGADESPCSD